MVTCRYRAVRPRTPVGGAPKGSWLAALRGSLTDTAIRKYIQKCVLIDGVAFLSLQPIQIINSTIEMVKPGKFPSGKTEIPFEFPLHVKGNKVLYETYHGVFVNIQVSAS